MACARCERLGEESGCDPKQFCECPKPKFVEAKRQPEVDGLALQAVRAVYELDNIMKSYRNRHREFITYDELEERLSVLLSYVDTLFETPE